MFKQEIRKINGSTIIIYYCKNCTCELMLKKGGGPIAERYFRDREYGYPTDTRRTCNKHKCDRPEPQEAKP